MQSDESLVLHEVLYALLGHTGEVVVEGGGGSLILADDVPLDASERALLGRLLRLGDWYRVLDGYVREHLFGAPSQGPPFQPSSPYATALASGVEECLKPYTSRVLEVEQQLLRCPEISIADLQLGFAEFELTMPTLAQLVGAVRREGLHGAALLDRLQSAASGASASTHTNLSALLWHMHRTLLCQLSGWLVHGQLPPDHAEFFIRRAPRRDGGMHGGGMLDRGRGIVARGARETAGAGFRSEAPRRGCVGKKEIKFGKKYNTPPEKSFY